MGNKKSTAINKTSEQKDETQSQIINANKVFDKNKYNMILMGGIVSGKSTVFQSIRLINNRPYNDTYLYELKGLIRKSCVRCIVYLIKKSQALYTENEQEFKTYYIDINDKEINNDKKIIEEANKIHNLPSKDIEKIGKSIENIWKLSGIKETYKYHLKGKYVLYPTDNMVYYLDKANIIFDKKWRIKQQDCLKAKVRASGIKKFEYKINDNK